MAKNTEVYCYVPPELLKRFRERFPMKSALSWVLRTGLEELMRATEGQPSTADLVKDSIRLAVVTQRNLNKKARQNGNTGSDTEPATAPGPRISVERLVSQEQRDDCVYPSILDNHR